MTTATVATTEKTATSDNGAAVVVPIDPAILNSPFIQTQAPQSLRITCYGSSASTTPEAYLKEARHLGYIIARRGHVCVNGAGSFGCMAAMNDGAARGNGHIVGVIHEMWLVKTPEETYEKDGVALRDGGAHKVFVSSSEGAPAPSAAAAANKEPSTNASNNNSNLNPPSEEQQPGVDNNTNSNKNSTEKGPIREMLVARGDNLQERKRLLVEKADGLVVLPGGPGTWDELWEMACSRNIGLTKLPIVCVNVNGYYNPFRDMLERAYIDKLTKLQPHEIVHFEDTAQAAVEWIEAIQANNKEVIEKALKKSRQQRESVLRKSSFMGLPFDTDTNSSLLGRLRQSFSGDSSGDTVSMAERWDAAKGLIFVGCLWYATGISTGLYLAQRNRKET